MYSKFATFITLVAGALAQDRSLSSVLANTSDLSNLTSYLSLFPNLLTSLNSTTNVTLLAPTNDALVKFLKSPFAIADTDIYSIQALFNYHILNGTYNTSQITSEPSFIPTHLTDTNYTNVTGGQRVEAIKNGNVTSFISGLVQTSNVTRADISFDGGYIHEIDTVLVPPRNISTTCLAADMTDFVGALSKSGIEQVLNEKPNVTVFVPINTAWERIGSIVENFTQLELARAIKYHVVNYTFDYTTALKNGTKLTSELGPTITVTSINGVLYVNSARIVVPNVLVSNGVVHFIDNVLNANASTVTPNPAEVTQSVAFSGASFISNLPFASNITAPASLIPAATAANATAFGTGATATTTSTGVAVAGAPIQTAAIGAVALFGAGVVFLNM